MQDVCKKIIVCGISPVNGESQIVYEQKMDLTFQFMNNFGQFPKRGKILLGLDGLLGILQKDKTYRGGQLKTVYLGLLELLSDDHPATRQYRADLSNALF